VKKLFSQSYSYLDSDTILKIFLDSNESDFVSVALKKIVVTFNTDGTWTTNTCSYCYTR
jgi:hypothetical protein